MTCRNSLVVGLLAAVFAGCTSIDIHTQPPADWPKLQEIVVKGSLADVHRACGVSPLLIPLMQVAGRVPVR